MQAKPEGAGFPPRNLEKYNLGVSASAIPGVVQAVIVLEPSDPECLAFWQEHNAAVAAMVPQTSKVGCPRQMA